MGNEADSRVQTVCLLILTAGLITGAIYWLRPVLLPFVIAVFVVSGVSPILSFVERRLGASRLSAAAITFLSGLLLIVMLISALWVSLLDLTRYAPAYQQRVGEIVQRVETMIPEKLLSHEAPRDGDNPAPKTSSLDEFQRFLDRSIRYAAGELTTTFLDLFSTSVIVLIYVFFLLLGAPAFPREVPSMWKELDSQIRNYLVLKTVISILTGAAFGFALWIFRIPMAFAFGMLAFLFNYIPNVGPLIASVLPIPFIVLHPEASWGWMALVIAVTTGIQFVSGNVVEPKMMGESSDLHPIVVLLALMFWGMIWGIVGMFLATPMTAGVKIVLDRFERTRPIAEVMAGRWDSWARPQADPKVA